MFMAVEETGLLGRDAFALAESTRSARAVPRVGEETIRAIRV